MKKNIFTFAICLIIMIVFAACGNKETGNSKISEGSNNPVQSSVNEVAEKSGTDIKVNMEKTGINMSLPDEFPKSIVPLLDDANIINVIDNKEAKAMGITYTTGKSFEDAVTFYQTVMKDAKERMESKVDNGHMFFGKKENIDISIVVSKYDGDKVSILLNVSTLNEKSNSSNPSEQNYFEEAKVVDLPKSYPKDKFPIKDGDKIIEASLSESESENAFYIIILSTKNMKELIEYYEAAWGKMENKLKNISSEDFGLEGNIGKYNIIIKGSIKDDKAQIVEYNILLAEYKE